MKTLTHKILGVLLLFTTVIFAQKHTKKISNRFTVNKGVIVEVFARNTDVTIETWNKNVVSVEGKWEVEGMVDDEVANYFKNSSFEALSNSKKVSIISKSEGNDNYDMMFGDMDFEPIIAFGDSFDFDFDSIIAPLPPEVPLPPMNNITELVFDHEAYEKDNEKYMAEFNKKQEKWGKEMKENFEPQMKEYEKKMEEWGKEFAKNFEPKMKKYEQKMEKWSKEFEAKAKIQNVKRVKIAEKRYETKNKISKAHKKKLKELKSKGIDIRGDVVFADNVKFNKTLVIKIPKTAKVKLDIKYGTTTLPNNLNTVD